MMTDIVPSPPSTAKAATASNPNGLDGPAIGKLRDLISEIFNEEDLEMQVRLNLRERLYDYVPQRGTLKYLVFKLIEAHEQRGTTVQLLRALFQARDKNTQFHDLLARVCPSALEAAKPETDLRTVTVALEDVEKRLENPDVMVVVLPHRGKLTELMDDIDVLANYKRLHDYLHTIQFNYYPQMADDVNRFRTEPLAAAALENAAFQLQGIVDDSRTAAEALPNTAIVREEQLRWIKTLESSVIELREAVDNSDEARAARAVRSMRQLIRQQPARLNTLLTITANKLALDSLIQTIEDVIGAVSAGGAPALDLENALRSLQNLLAQLKGRIREHEEWQDIENRFLGIDRFIASATQDSIEEFEILWPDIKALVESLARANSEADWAKVSRKYAGLIDQEFPNNIDSVQKNSILFRHTVLFHFFQVDRALRSQLEAIVKIRQPLRSLLDKV
jgi:hypothetical protein